LRDFRPDVLHYVNPFAFGFRCYDEVQKAGLRVPSVFSFHTLYGEFVKQYKALRPLSNVLWWIMREYHNRADVNITVSSVTRDELEKRCFERVRVWPPAVDGSLFHPGRKSAAMRARLAGGHMDRPLLVTVSRLAPEKNVGFLAHVLDQLPNATLAIVGDGPQRGELEERFRGKSARFVGYLKGAQLAEAYASADAFVYASETETMGNVVLEAMACGCAVIAPRAGGIPSLVWEGETALLYTPGNLHEAVRATRRVLTDDAVRQRLGRSAREMVQDWTWENSIARVREVYGEAIARVRQAPARPALGQRLAQVATSGLVFGFRSLSRDPVLRPPAAGAVFGSGPRRAGPNRGLFRSLLLPFTRSTPGTALIFLPDCRQPGTAGHPMPGVPRERRTMPGRAETPLHERVKPLGWVRKPLRRALFSLLRKVSNTEDAREIAAQTLKGLPGLAPGVLDGSAALVNRPYPELGEGRRNDGASHRTDVVIITARFRTGSTLLWNLFRHLDGVTAYYEPLNERRWFDPAMRGDRVDSTHRNVSEYWREYQGLEELGRHYQESWNSRNLFMDASFWDPDLKRYVELLIDRAPGRPVLQFNRIDFRLPWFRRNFPGARIVHLYRHPRDQWCSSLMTLDSFPPEGTVADFGPCDHYYLLNWARDLKYQFPFLDPRAVSHPYELFYYLWKLSYLFGRHYAHHSLAFEDLVDSPAAELARLFAALDVPAENVARVQGLIGKPALGRWQEYAEDAWFRRHEMSCETVLTEFFR
jgi:glycosyltransferase involved in cell wall biosynthesis